VHHLFFPISHVFVGTTGTVYKQLVSLCVQYSRYAFLIASSLLPYGKWHAISFYWCVWIVKWIGGKHHTQRHKTHCESSFPSANIEFV